MYCAHTHQEVFLLQAGGGEYLFRVGKVIEKRGLTPDNSLLLVCLGVFETCCLTSLSTEQTLPRHEHQHAHAHKTYGNGVPVKVRSDFVAFTRADCMALGTTRLEKLSTALSVTYDRLSTRMSFRKGIYGHISYQERKALVLKGETEKGRRRVD